MKTTDLYHHRRASLGLAIQGPFSRNHRRQHRRYIRLREYSNTLLVLTLATALAAFITVLFL